MIHDDPLGAREVGSEQRVDAGADLGEQRVRRDTHAIERDVGGAQAVVLLLFVVLGYRAVKAFRTAT